jgi:hypothetical protein
MAVISKVESPNDHGACILVHMGLASDLRCWRGCRTGVPADTDEITQEWLTAAFDQAGALDQARVTSIQPAPIGQLGFTGQIRRLQISYDKPEPCAPRSRLCGRVGAGQSCMPLGGMTRISTRCLGSR